MDVFFTLDLIGTAVFAYTGSVAAKQQRFHILGVLYISFLTAIGGGTLRGVLLQTPELFWMKSSSYFLVVCSVVIASYVIKINMNRLWFYVLDSQSLAVFVALGVQQTLLHGQPLHIAFAMGVLSGIGGGLIRDAITSQPPQALTDPAYPVIMMAAALGSTLAIQLDLPSWTLACLAALVIVFCSAAINYYRSGRLINYDRTRQSRDGAAAHPDSLDGKRASGVNSDAELPAAHNARHRHRKPKSGLMAIVHAGGVLVLSCIAGLYYFDQSITNATANVSVNNTTRTKLPASSGTVLSVPTKQLDDEKIQYLAVLQSIESQLDSRQPDKAEHLINDARRNSFSDYKIEPLAIKARNLRTYLIALDQADLALASNDTATLKESIAIASGLGYSDHRLDTLRMSLKNSLERAAIETANDTLARKSIKLHLASARHHLGLGNIDLAFTEIETARSFGINDRMLDQLREQIDSAKLFDSTPLTDADFEFAATRFKQLKQAIKLRNLQAISSLTADNIQRRNLFTSLFERYVEINANVEGLSIQNNSKIINATLTLENMRLPDGNMTYPPSSYGEINLSIQRTRQGWSKINW